MKNKIVLNEAEYKKLIKKFANNRLKIEKINRSDRRKILKEGIDTLYLTDISTKISDMFSTAMTGLGAPDWLGGGGDPIGNMEKSISAIQDALLGNYLLHMGMTGQGYLGESLNFLDDLITFPVNGEEFSQIYSFWYAFIKKDDESLFATKALMALYAQRNMDLYETIADILNPTDPINLLMYALAPATSGLSLLILGGKKSLQKNTTKQLRALTTELVTDTTERQARRKGRQDTIEVGKEELKKVKDKITRPSKGEEGLGSAVDKQLGSKTKFGRRSKRQKEFDRLGSDGSFFYKHHSIGGVDLSDIFKMTSDNPPVPIGSLKELSDDMYRHIKDEIDDIIININQGTPSIINRSGFDFYDDIAENVVNRMLKDAAMTEYIKKGARTDLLELVTSTIKDKAVRSGLETIRASIGADIKQTFFQKIYNNISTGFGDTVDALKGSRVGKYFNVNNESVVEELYTGLGIDKRTARILSKNAKKSKNELKQINFNIEDSAVKFDNAIEAFDQATKNIHTSQLTGKFFKELKTEILEFSQGRKTLLLRFNEELGKLTNDQLDEVLTKIINARKSKDPDELVNAFAGVFAGDQNEMFKAISFFEKSKELLEKTKKGLLDKEGDTVGLGQYGDAGNPAKLQKFTEKQYKDMIDDPFDELFDDVIAGFESSCLAAKKAKDAIDGMDITEEGLQALKDKGLGFLTDPAFMERIGAKKIAGAKKAAIKETYYQNHRLIIAMSIEEGIKELGYGFYQTSGFAQPSADKVGVGTTEYLSKGQETQEFKLRKAQIDAKRKGLDVESQKDIKIDKNQPMQKIKLGVGSLFAIPAKTKEQETKAVQNPDMAKNAKTEEEDIVPDTSYKKAQNKFESDIKASRFKISLSGFLEQYDRITRAFSGGITGGGIKKIDQLARDFKVPRRRAETYKDIGKITFISTFDEDTTAFTKENVMKSELNVLVNHLANTLKKINRGASKDEVEDDLITMPKGISSPLESDVVASCYGALRSYPINTVKFKNINSQFDYILKRSNISQGIAAFRKFKKELEKNKEEKKSISPIKGSNKRLKPVDSVFESKKIMSEKELREIVKNSIFKKKNVLINEAPGEEGKKEATLNSIEDFKTLIDITLGGTKSGGGIKKIRKMMPKDISSIDPNIVEMNLLSSTGAYNNNIFKLYIATHIDTAYFIYRDGGISAQGLKNIKNTNIYDPESNSCEYYGEFVLHADAEEEESKSLTYDGTTKSSSDWFVAGQEKTLKRIFNFSGGMKPGQLYQGYYAVDLSGGSNDEGKISKIIDIKPIIKDNTSNKNFSQDENVHEFYFPINLLLNSLQTVSDASSGKEFISQIDMYSSPYDLKPLGLITNPHNAPNPATAPKRENITYKFILDVFSLDKDLTNKRTSLLSDKLKNSAFSKENILNNDFPSKASEYGLSDDKPYLIFCAIGSKESLSNLSDSIKGLTRRRWWNNYASEYASNPGKIQKFSEFYTRSNLGQNEKEVMQNAKEYFSTNQILDFKNSYMTFSTYDNKEVEDSQTDAILETLFKQFKGYKLDQESLGEEIAGKEIQKREEQEDKKEEKSTGQINPIGAVKDLFKDYIKFTRGESIEFDDENSRLYYLDAQGATQPNYQGSSSKYSINKNERPLSRSLDWNINRPLKKINRLYPEVYALLCLNKYGHHGGKNSTSIPGYDDNLYWKKGWGDGFGNDSGIIYKNSGAGYENELMEAFKMITDMANQYNIGPMRNKLIKKAWQESGETSAWHKFFRKIKEIFIENNELEPVGYTGTANSGGNDPDPKRINLGIFLEDIYYNRSITDRKSYSYPPGLDETKIIKENNLRYFISNCIKEAKDDE